MILQYRVIDNKFYNLKEILKVHFQLSDNLITKLKQNRKILLNSEFTYLDHLVKINDFVEIDLDLEESSENWHEGTNDNTAFIKYILGIILSAYRDFEDRLILIEDKISAYEMVERIAKNQLGKFKKSDIQEHCPTLARQTIEKALKQLCDEGKIEKHGQASKTFYIWQIINS